MSGIYIHIPFCKQACSYCDFYFVTQQNLKSQFIKRLCEEIESYEGSGYTEETVKTIYLGGGTPSLLSAAELEQILTTLRRVFKVESEETTIELNPDDVSKDYLRDLRLLGINRASMGVQTFDKERLKFMNRAHTPGEARNALDYLGKTGFQVHTVDLIYGNPGQTLKDLEHDINQLLEFDPPHISAYALTIEPRTRLGKKVELGRLNPADDELVAEHFDLLNEKLFAHGIQRYEVSNYCKPGAEAVHNTNYWNHANYLGFGPSSHSFWWDESRAIRWKSVSDIRHYLQKPLTEIDMDREVLTDQELGEERLMLGLRTRDGVSIKELKDRYHYKLNNNQLDWIAGKQNEGLLNFNGLQIKMTNEGIKIADHLIVELLTRK
jgi:oxygen-independent coproporphyrinogen III oxidase